MGRSQTVICQARNWGEILRKRTSYGVEWVVEKCIMLVSLSAVIVILLIFIFLGRESAPVFFGRLNSALIQDVIQPADIDKYSAEQLRNYLGLTRKQFARLDRETLLALLDARVEAQTEIPESIRSDKDARLNTIKWRYMLLPHQWTGYDKPVYIWQPVGYIPKYNIVPLIVGSLKITFVALLFAMPLAVGAAIYVSQLAPPTVRELVKPAIELLSGIPSVVIGFFALVVMATFLQKIFGYETRLNAFVAGIALGLAVIPIVFSIAEDALNSVPQSYVEAALALGATKWQTAWQVILPAALPGVFAAGVLGFGRAIGETMIVMMVCSASVMSWSIFDPARAITTTIAAEMAEAVVGGHHYRVLFMLGTLLLAVTFVSNMVGDAILRGLKRKLEGKQ